MKIESHSTAWPPGSAPVAVVMISLNEGHNLEAVCRNLAGWAEEVFLVDSFSQDDTVDIALRNGVHVVQRRFNGFGDQWNFALSNLPITAPWTMKLDPDERISEGLKREIALAIERKDSDAFMVNIRLFFMGRMLPVRLKLLRIWKTGMTVFSGVAVNEHARTSGKQRSLAGDVEHHDSPDLDHWLEKQNRYTTAEAVIAHNNTALADVPRLLGTPLQRRMWLKKHFHRVPLRFFLFFIYPWLWLGAWRAGWVGYAWARLRSDVMRLIEYKRREIELTGRLPEKRVYGSGKPDPRVKQFE